MVQIGESVKVFALFDPAFKLRPLKFLWKERPVTVREITYVWKSTKGDSVIWHFAVCTETGLYELSLDASSMLWRLEAVDAG